MKSTEIIKPAALVAPLAFNGTKNSIPDSATGTNAASVAEGFPAVTSLPKSEGGLPPARADFNGMFYLSTDQKVYLQNGGILTFSKDVSDAIGGYPKGAILDYFDAKNNTFSKVQSLIDDNTYNFVETPSYINDEYWQMLNFGGANVALSNISDVGLDKLNQSKALETGNISTDPNVCSEILEYAHSTFDKSKFSITGSPTISDDGVASGFNSSNFVACRHNTTTNITYRFKVTLNTIRPSKATCIFKINNTNESTNRVLIYEAVTATGVAISSGGKSSSVLSLTAGKTYYFEFKVIATNSTLTAYNEDLSVAGTTTIDMSEPVQAYGFNLGVTSGYEPWYGEFDLKSIAIWTDSVPVLNGNKTGLDIIKADNFEKVGDVTVTNDGIASGFSASNYIQLEEIQLQNAKNWEVEVPVFWNNAEALDSEQILVGFSTSYPFIYKSATSSTGFSFAVNSDYRITTNYVAKENKNYILKCGWTGIQYYIKVYEDNVLVKTTTYDSDVASSTSIKYIGRGIINTASFQKGSIDLNLFKVYVDGNLVYQPCLKIPYTLSKTGSKIVDVSARNRVQDLYKQTGEALYYTIDEQNKNFTLPMGEIYGMISSSKDILDIVYPIGRPMLEENNQLLSNEIWLEGAVINIVDYPKLFEVYGTAYGGDGVTTFGLPDLRERTLWGSSDSSKGYLEAALPNITGYFEGVASYEDHNGGSGALFYTKSGYSTTLGHANFQYQHTWANVNIDASRSNPIYGRGNTVRTPSFKVRYKTRFK